MDGTNLKLKISVVSQISTLRMLVTGPFGYLTANFHSERDDFPSYVSPHSYTGNFIFTYSQTFFEGAQAKDILLGTFFEQKKLHD